MSEECKKLERDGKIAVLVSLGYGAGWYSWDHGDNDAALFDPDIVNAVLNKDYKAAELIAAEKYPDMYGGGIEDLVVEWLPKGTAFRIHEYDGFESIEIRDSIYWLIA